MKRADKPEPDLISGQFHGPVLSCLRRTSNARVSGPTSTNSIFPTKTHRNLNGTLPRDGQQLTKRLGALHAPHKHCTTWERRSQRKPTSGRNLPTLSLQRHRFPTACSTP
ncbi:hypothetical protein MTP99_009084 [Tenebrio molitor]|nr:hypothetical protein MTP99_009084 [Tenebrio molitor]